MEILLSQFFGALFGFLAIVFGAFGAHALKNKLTEEQLHSFETGVKYQMYHAIVLLVISFNLNFNSSLETILLTCFIVGTLLFSFSIYGLVLSSASGNKMRFLGPVTPLGGLLLAIGWLLLMFNFFQNFF
ncbi:DUF423 domain-containing protein [Leeuwenhoekiella sp. LLG6367-2.1]|mgnify:FL=1|uniref:DUF423 domain-containing protein n=1 Tax=Leeuwenhoekiella sp. LLG6367-2.1 TaxID=3160833 RepID=UPI00386E692E